MRRVLVVDDDKNARSALSEILGDEGYDVRVAADGLQALSALREFEPEVVITDVRMPGLDGIGLMHAAEMNVPTPHVILMSAERPKADQTTPFVSKPIDVDDLLAVLEATLAS